MSDGSEVVPATDNDWSAWVSATATRNFLLDDPLLDWLNLFGVDSDFVRDSDLDIYDPRTDFTQFIFRKSQEFEAVVFNHLSELATIHTVAANQSDARDRNKAEETWQLMSNGEAVIYQGVLRNAELQVFGIPDLLIRSDELLRLFPGSISKEESEIAAADLGDVNWHYRVVDIKYTTLRLLAGGALGNSGSFPAYKGQLYLYNQMLGYLQGYEPDCAYLIGRSWEQQVKGKKLRGRNSMERLAPVPQNSTLVGGVRLGEKVQAAVDWVRHVRRDGSNWQVLPEPSHNELRPNLSNDQDAPWHFAKRAIAEELEDLMLLWYVGISGRRRALRDGLSRWTDDACTPAAVGVTGEKRAPVLQALLEINQNRDGPPISPQRITLADQVWRNEPALEFYVDFETTNDLHDRFEGFPERGGQAMIFMVGCGHVDANGDWTYECFCARRLTEDPKLRFLTLGLNI